MTRKIFIEIKSNASQKDTKLSIGIHRIGVMIKGGETCG